MGLQLAQRIDGRLTYPVRPAPGRHPVRDRAVAPLGSSAQWLLHLDSDMCNEQTANQATRDRRPAQRVERHDHQYDKHGRQGESRT